MGTDLTPGQRAALETLQAGVGEMPSFGAESSDAISKLFGATTAPQIGMLSDAFSTLQKNIGGTASGAELNPYMTPGFSDAIGTMTDDITNKVKSTYAAAGRDPSGAGSFAGSLGRGLTEGIAPVIADQYNKNKATQMGAAGSLFSAGGSTATGMTAQQQAEYDALLKGLGGVGAATSNALLPGQAALQAANTAYNLPWTNLSQLLNPLVAIGGLGGQSSGTTTATQPQSTMSNIIGGVTAGATLLPLLFSDERVKEDIVPVGMLNDGQSVYRYRYKGDPTFQIGLLAQDVAETAPDSVYDVGGILAVDYKGATERAATMERMAA